MSIPFERSFASHLKSKYWSKKNTKKTSECYKSSHSKYLFDCDKCFHEFEGALNSITRGRWCPYCANIILCNNETCKTCLNKSFLSNPKSKCWSKNNVNIPREMFKSSNKKCLFDCDKCFHEFECKLNDITNANNWCIYCANQKLCNNEDCKTCLNKSFASHEKRIFWSKNNDKTPRELFKSTHTICLFDCICGHNFETSLNSITNRNSWCGYCSNPPKFLCNNNDCKTCFNKSFALDFRVGRIGRAS